MMRLMVVNSSCCMEVSFECAMCYTSKLGIENRCLLFQTAKKFEKKKLFLQMVEYLAEVSREEKFGSKFEFLF